MAVDFDKIKLRMNVRKVVDSLPQRRVIPDDVAERWIDGILARDPERAVWHAERARGIGGSEIGELVLHASGQPTTYNTLEEISRAKLLLDLPSNETIHMARGTAMEPLAQRTYWAISKHKSILDQPDIQSAFQSAHPKHRWLVGNPDEVVNAGRMGRLITDFKVRSNLNHEDDMKLINACQLHWYGLKYEGHFNKLPDGYGLAELDIPSELIDSLRAEDQPDFEGLAQTIASVNRPGFGMQIRYFKHNPALAEHMCRLADAFWNNHVLTGTPYLKPKPQKPDHFPEDMEKAIQDKLNNLVRFKIAEGVSKTESDRVRGELFAIAEQFELKEWPFEVAGLSAGYSKTFDTANAAARLMAAGVPKSDLTRPSETLDTEAALQTLKSHDLLDDSHFKPTWDGRAIKKALKEHGLLASDFEINRFRAAITTKKAEQDVRQQLEQSMGTHIQMFGRTQAPTATESTAVEAHAANSGVDVLVDIDDTDEVADIRLG